MREAKFRAWDKTEKEFVSGVSARGMIDYTENGIVIDGCDIWELMQYTGLKDKNGVEIYEGDIVQVYDYGWEDGDEDGEYGLFQKDRIDIVTMDRFPIYWLEKEGFGYEGEDLTSPEATIVIGNIYEHAELLEAK